MIITITQIGKKVYITGNHNSREAVLDCLPFKMYGFGIYVNWRKLNFGMGFGSGNHDRDLRAALMCATRNWYDEDICDECDRS